jgi:CheY-like chemotaxis protein
VAEGLLAPYKARVDSCISGYESIALAEKQPYDLIFMDHMMPGMDGIEAAAAIRALDLPYVKDIPIIALTANAVSGMREMFLSKGFNDYLSKPIEISKLDDIMGKWIPPEKRSKADIVITGKGESFPTSKGIIIKGVDTARGLVLTGGTESAYRKVLRSFCKDAEDRLPLLEKMPDEGTVTLFTITVHALKSAAATIGAVELSQQAAELEAAGKKGNLEVIWEKLPVFYQKLQETTANIGEAVKEVEAETPVSQGDPQVQELLVQLKSALEVKNMKETDRLLAEIEGMPLDAALRNKIIAVSDQVLITEFSEALAILEV